MFGNLETIKSRRKVLGCVDTQMTVLMGTVIDVFSSNSVMRCLLILVHQKKG